MARYALRRILQSLPILLGITLIVFFIIRLAPGDPFSGMIDPRIKPEDLELARDRLGLNAPIYIQYLKWLGQLLQGDLGYSLRFKQPVAELIASRLPNSLLLAVFTQLIVFLVGIPVGVMAATRKNSWLDYAVTGLAFAGLAMPTFFFGLLLLRTFAFQLKWLPSSGMVTPGTNLTGLPYILDVAAHMLLPALMLGLVSVAGLMRYVRSGMLEVLRQDFVRVARAKGLAGRVVIYKHALRNALIPVITVLGLELPTLVGGAIITETIFSWPGMGVLSYTALLERDYPVLMGVNLMFAVLTLTGNLLADLGYALVDPRIRYD